jgi:hypothetical protein
VVLTSTTNGLPNPEWYRAYCREWRKRNPAYMKTYHKKHAALYGHFKKNRLK